MQYYSKTQKFLHDLVLSKDIINKSLFEIEKVICLKNMEIKDQNHIFITGLPRSGTTSLLNFIYSSNQYASLTYKSMPFIFSPNFSKFFNNKNISKKKRIHNDGITYDMNSPEAFDEVFFKTDEKFIKKELVNYIQLICLSENKIKYLSKNNLNYSRIDLISNFFPNCNFLILIREPLQHSYSLLKQHLNFSNLQKNDDFIRRYMNYLGHNEFGLNHKSWNNPVNYHDVSGLNYWLEQWSLFYQNIINQYQFYKNCHFIFYEELTNIKYLKIMLEKINFNEIDNLNLKYFQNFNKKELVVDFSKDVYENASNIYNDFKDKFMLKP